MVVQFYFKLKSEIKPSVPWTRIFCTIVLGLFFSTISTSSYGSMTKELDQLHFQYKSPQAREVSVIFSFDNYRHVYHMSETKEGIFEFHLLPEHYGMQLPPGRYFYMFLVDGIPTADPDAPYSYNQFQHLKISYFDISKTISPIGFKPIALGNRTYRFFLHMGNKINKKNIEAHYLSVVGDFNAWNSYTHPFQYNQEEEYFYVDVKFPEPGNYKYLFYIDDNYTIDPMNENVIKDKSNNLYSMISVTE